MALVCASGLMIGQILLIAGSKKKPRDNFNIVVGIIMMIMGTLSIFASPSRDNPSGNDDLAGFCTLVIIVAFGAFCYRVYKKGKKLQSEREEKKRIEISKNYDKKAKEMYLKITKENYDIKKNDVLEVLASTYKISINELKNLYKRGKEVLEEDKIKEKEEENRKIKQKELDAKRANEEFVEKERQKTLVIGKDKYINYLKESRKTVTAIKDIYKIMSDSYVSGAVQASRPQQSDPYFWAGMANGIAGPAAAMMTANDIEKENAKKRELSKQIAEGSMQEAIKYGKMAADEDKKVSGIVGEIDEYIKNIENALIDENTERIKKLIDIEVLNINITKTNMIHVTVKNHLKDIKVLDKKGVLDGSFFVKVLNSNNKIVGIGYYNGGNAYVDSKGLFSSLSSIGFNNKENTISCMTNFEFEKDDKLGLHCVFEPIHLWIIEKKWK